jgi:DNA-binding CsgD family transcriptional regulator
MVGEAGRLWDAVYEIAWADDVEQFRLAVARGVCQVVAADLSSYTEVNLLRHEVIASLDPPIDAPGIAAALGRLAHQHPLITRSAAHAETISDYLSVKAFHRLELYAEVYRPLQAEDQLAINLDRPDGTVIGVALNRGHRSFNQHDREQLDLLRGHILRGYYRVQARERATALLAQLESRPDDRAVGVIGLSRDGRPAFISDRARRWLCAYFGSSSGAPWPAELAGWIDAQPRDQPAHLTVAGGPGCLDLTLMVSQAGAPRLLELRERARVPLARLTAREQEILELVALGESNLSIARALEVSHRTVENHLQAIYRKLRVPNRTAAAAALRRGWPDGQRTPSQPT